MFPGIYFNYTCIKITLVTKWLNGAAQSDWMMCNIFGTQAVKQLTTNRSVLRYNCEVYNYTHKRKEWRWYYYYPNNTVKILEEVPSYLTWNFFLYKRDLNYVSIAFKKFQHHGRRRSYCFSWELFSLTMLLNLMFVISQEVLRPYNHQRNNIIWCLSNTCNLKLKT